MTKTTTPASGAKAAKPAPSPAARPGRTDVVRYRVISKVLFVQGGFREEGYEGSAKYGVIEFHHRKGTLELV